MPFNKLKDKLNEIAGNETLGSAKVKQEETPVDEVVQPTEDDSFEMYKESTSEIDDIVDIAGGSFEEGYEDVLAVLNISPEAEVNAPFTADDLSYIEFSQTTPVGFDFDEVADFVERMQYILVVYENAMKSRDEDVLRLASEIKKVEKKLVSQNQDKQLEMMMGGMSDEDRLRDENFELKLEVNDLRSKVKSLSSNNVEITRLKKRIKELENENEFLKLGKSSEGSAKKTSDSSDGLPTLDDILGPSPKSKAKGSNDGDLLDDMLDSMKGEFK